MAQIDALIQLKEHRAEMATTTVNKTEKQILNNLAVLGGSLTRESDIVYEGVRFTLPERYRHDSRGALLALGHQFEQDQEVTIYRRTFRVRPFDGALAAAAALKKTFGMLASETEWGFFGPSRPQLTTIPVGVGVTAEVPWGMMSIPALPDSTIHFQATQDDEWGPLFEIAVKAPKKYRDVVQGLFKVVDEEVRTGTSIYRGHALDGKNIPDFIDLSGVDPSRVVYSEQVRRDLAANVWTPIVQHDLMRSLGRPLKRAVLLSGEYGTGKTLTMFLTAKVAVEHGWTVVLVRPGQDNMFQALQTARLYQRALVLMEDADNVGSSESGSDNYISALLDTFDGIQAKGNELFVLMTTNHPERIHPGMVRPGRIDRLISFEHLDAGAISDFAHAQLPQGSIGADVDWAAVEAATQGYVPAFLTEVMSSAILYGISREGGYNFVLTTEDFVGAANSLRPQWELQQSATRERGTPSLDAALKAIVTDVQNRSMVTYSSHDKGVYDLEVTEPTIYQNGQS